MKGILDTSSITFRQLMGNGLRYEVPKFQRDYSWEEEQWDDLWFDIDALMKNEEYEHYMGYLVLQSMDNKNFVIIDGQQRITTLSILVLTVLKCLTELAENDIEKENNFKRIDALRNSYIGYIDPVTLISANKLKLNRNSDDYYRNFLVLLKELPQRNINNSERNMRNCFLYFYNKVKNVYNTGESLAQFIDSLADKLFFTRIVVSDEFNAYKVFETLNARGVQLSAADLLKNYLFSVIDATGPHSSELDELENLWTGIIDQLGSVKLEDYLRYYWNSKNKTVRKNILFKAIRNNIKNRSDAFSLVRELRETVELFMAFQEPDSELWKSDPELQKCLKELELFQIKQHLSLFISGKKYLKDEDFKRLVKAISVISFRYNVIGGYNPNNQEDIYNSVALKIYNKKKFTLQDLKDVYVDDRKFENDFSTKAFKNTTRNNKIVKYILSNIDRHIYNSDISYESDLFTIEHIMPENPGENWKNIDSETLNRYVYRIGNLALLEKNLNKKASNMSYAEKKGIFARSSCIETKKIAKQYDDWDINTIIERQKILAKQAKAIWKFHSKIS